jgi:hypothetical protein
MIPCLDKTFPFQFLVFKKSLHGIRQNAHWIARTLFGKKMPKNNVPTRCSTEG